ncbi:MAG: hypothetical protein AMXMBFR58_27300 [Phycisphaerae bacterium]|nr:DUF1579 domain-containing protein [Phycisphaerales bacterium]
MKRIVRIGLVGVASLSASLVFAQPAKDTRTQPAKPADKTAQPAGQPGQQPPLPEGWTDADMQACIEAGTPGQEHAFLAESVGTWSSKCTMWMTPGGEPMKSEGTTTVQSIMDGRFITIDMKGEMPGMGPYTGFSIVGYDNVAKKFQATWVDNMGTTMAIGTGDRSSDGKTMTWSYTYTCPVNKKPTTMREIHKQVSKDSKVIETYATEPKSGKEFKMMEVELTRTSPASKATTPAPAVKTR